MKSANMVFVIYGGARFSFWELKQDFGKFRIDWGKVLRMESHQQDIISKLNYPTGAHCGVNSSKNILFSLFQFKTGKMFASSEFVPVQHFIDLPPSSSRQAPF